MGDGENEFDNAEDHIIEKECYKILIKEKTNEIEIIFEKKYIEEKMFVERNYEKISNLISDLWGLIKPESIKIIITDSYTKYCLNIYSINELIALMIIFPYWLFKIRHFFKEIGAIDLNVEKPSILIKSMNFFKKKPEVGVGNLIYIESKNIQEKYKHGFVSLIISIRLHEIKCPKWLGSGIGSFTSEKFLSRNIVRKDTINLLSIQNKNKDLNSVNTAYPHVLGYWTVRYLEENYPGFLKKIFKRYKGEEIVDQIRLQLGLSQENFWDQLDELLYENYKHLLDNK